MRSRIIDIRLCLCVAILFCFAGKCESKTLKLEGVVEPGGKWSHTFEVNSDETFSVNMESSGNISVKIFETFKNGSVQQIIKEIVSTELERGIRNVSRGFIKTGIKSKTHYMIQIETKDNPVNFTVSLIFEKKDSLNSSAKLQYALNNFNIRLSKEFNLLSVKEPYMKKELDKYVVAVYERKKTVEKMKRELDEYGDKVKKQTNPAVTQSMIQVYADKLNAYEKTENGFKEEIELLKMKQAEYEGYKLCRKEISNMKYLIEKSRRTGDLSEVKKFLDNSEYARSLGW